MQCNIHPDNQEFLTPNPFSPAVCKICLLGSKKPVATIIYENDELREPERIIKRRIRPFNPNPKPKLSKQELKARMANFLKTGKATCYYHGEHTRWRHYIHGQALKPIIACKMCESEKCKKYYETHLKKYRSNIKKDVQSINTQKSSK